MSIDHRVDRESFTRSHRAGLPFKELAEVYGFSQPQSPHDLARRLGLPYRWKARGPIGNTVRSTANG